MSLVTAKSRFTKRRFNLSFSLSLFVFPSRLSNGTGRAIREVVTGHSLLSARGKSRVLVREAATRRRCETFTGDVYKRKREDPGERNSSEPSWSSGPPIDRRCSPPPRRNASCVRLQPVRLHFVTTHTRELFFSHTNAPSRARAHRHTRTHLYLRTQMTRRARDPESLRAPRSRLESGPDTRGP